MKFYIASRLENHEKVKRLASLLRQAGWEHTYDWTVHGMHPCTVSFSILPLQRTIINVR